MSPEIHGALVGGAIGGVVVVTGVVLAEAAVRLRRRRQVIDADALEIAIVAPHVTSAVWEGAMQADPEDPALAEWHEKNERVAYLAAEILTSARWPIRNAREIRRHVRRLAARLAAAYESGLRSGETLTWAELGHVHGVVADVTRAVFRGRIGPLLEHEIDHHAAHGYEIDFEECAECAAAVRPTSESVGVTGRLPK